MIGSLHDAHATGYHWFRTCEDDNIILSFKGDINQDLVNAVLYLAEKRDEVAGNTVLTRNRIFGIMVECLQNIHKHGEGGEANPELKPGIILISKTEEGFVIGTGNMIRNEEVGSFREKLEKIKPLTNSELKSMHIDKLTETELDDNSNAGLGLIYVFRRSDKVDYQFSRVSDTHSFFTMEVTILIPEA
jgi:hypothetical protein